MKNLWIVPGAPLSKGQGWVIWCSRKGETSFTPPDVMIRRQAAPVTFQTDWVLLPKVPGLRRRMGLLTVKLATPAPPEGAQFHLTLSANNQSQDSSGLPCHIKSGGKV
jgi:hypothetical protein